MQPTNKITFTFSPTLNFIAKQNKSFKISSFLAQRPKRSTTKRSNTNKTKDKGQKTTKAHLLRLIRPMIRLLEQPTFIIGKWVMSNGTQLKEKLFHSSRVIFRPFFERCICRALSSYRSNGRVLARIRYLSLCPNMIRSL